MCYLIYDLKVFGGPLYKVTGTGSLGLPILNVIPGADGTPIGQACLSNTVNFISILTLRVKPDFGVLVEQDAFGNSFYMFWKKNSAELMMMGRVELDN